MFPDIVFHPQAEEVYNGHEIKSVDFGYLENIMEGEFRPGHFKGVAAVVQRFFEIVKPNKAYFGKKDYQQYVIVDAMVGKLGLPIEIKSCETSREESGLAMSSRNRLLSSNGHRAASLFYISLKKAALLVGTNTVYEITSAVSEDFKQSPECTLEYFQIVDTKDLSEVVNKEEHDSIIACIAGYVDNVRLIDNLVLIP